MAAVVLIVVALASVRARAGRRERALLAVVAVSVGGVFASDHLVIILASWQAMLVATWMLLAAGQGRASAATQTFAAITFAGTLAAVVSAVALAAARGTFDLDLLAARPVPAGGQALPALLMLLPFLTALPLFPMHGWALRAQVAAPARSALLLPGIVATAALYAMLRVCLPLFPQGVAALAPALVALAAAGALYAGIVAARAGDSRRFIAYASLCHVALAAVALFSGSPGSARAAVLVAVSHALVVPALLLVTSQEAWPSSRIARAAVAAMIGVPGTSGFAAVSLALVTAWERHPLAAIIAGAGVALVGVAGLRLATSAHDHLPVAGARRRGGLLAAPLLAASITFGLAPWLVTDRVPTDPGTAERYE